MKGRVFLCSRTQRRNASEAQTPGPSVSSPALYHLATALPADIVDAFNTISRYLDDILNIN